MLSPVSTHFLFQHYADHRDLPSFPTRRSSDLVMKTSQPLISGFLLVAVLLIGYGCASMQQQGTVVPITQADLASLAGVDRKSTRLNSSHLGISYAVFCLKKKNNATRLARTTAG